VPNDDDDDTGNDRGNLNRFKILLKNLSNIPGKHEIKNYK
jgi:hypothetical protein